MATMKAAVYGGEGIISVEDRPIPKIQGENEVILKVLVAAICGSDLHLYRGLEVYEPGFIMGHEFCGIVVEAGSGIKNFKVGDKVVAPFTVNCGECFYCEKGLSSRCVEQLLFGCPRLDGAQAEYVRVIFADSSLMHAPEDIDNDLLVLLGDIYVTGYFASINARDAFKEEDRKDAICVVIGCGPVGICAISAATEWVTPGNLYAIDSVPDRLEQASRHGAIPLKLGSPEAKDAILKATDGRGADACLEIVGLEAAYQLAYDLIRPFGFISSVGVHSHGVMLTGSQAWDKNVRTSFGRCPVRSLFPEALESLRRQKAKFEGTFVSHAMDLTEATEAYKMFNEHKARKIVFRMK